MLAHMQEKIKLLVASIRPRALPAVFLFLGILGILGVIRLALIFPQKAAIRIEKSDTVVSHEQPRANNDLPYVASINGSAYYRISCTGVKRIREENRIFFATAKEAEETGYRPAKNCPP